MHFPSAGLPGHCPKLLVIQQLASCRFVGTRLVFVSRPPKIPPCLEIRERERQTDRQTEKQQQQQQKKKKIAFGIKLNEKQYHRADCGQNDCFFTSKTEEALQFFCPNNGEKLLLLQAGSCMTILCLLHVDIPMVSIVVPKVKQLAQCRLDMASVCTAYIHCHTPHPVPSELKGY